MGVAWKEWDEKSVVLLPGLGRSLDVASDSIMCSF